MSLLHMPPAVQSSGTVHQALAWDEMSTVFLLYWVKITAVTAQVLLQSGDEPPSKIICSLRGPLDLALELHFVSISFASMSKLEMANLDMRAEESESSPKAALPRSRAW